MINRKEFFLLTVRSKKISTMKHIKDSSDTTSNINNTKIEGKKYYKSTTENNVSNENTDIELNKKIKKRHLGAKLLIGTLAFSLLIGNSYGLAKTAKNVVDMNNTFSSQHGDYDSLNVIHTKTKSKIFDAAITKSEDGKRGMVIAMLDGENQEISTFPYNIKYVPSDLFHNYTYTKIESYTSSFGKQASIIKIDNISDDLEKAVSEEMLEFNNSQSLYNDIMPIDQNDLLSKYQSLMENRSPNTIYIMAFEM